MTTETVHARLRGFGVPPTSSTIVVEHLGLSRRLARAAVALALGVAAAAVARPIPIVHFVLVPGSLLLGLVFAGTRLTQRDVVRSAEGSCPFCGTRQWLGLAGRRFRLPRRVHCESCGRELDLDPLA